MASRFCTHTWGWGWAVGQACGVGALYLENLTKIKKTWLK